MAHRLTILYRGPLASCNFRCGYCPFAKRRESAARLAEDRQALERFCAWAAGTSDRLALFFTPWGEALIRPWYREAVVELSRLAHVTRVAVQTNLSSSLEWLDRCDRRRLALWCTYHPGQVSRRQFLARCRRLDALSIRYSVGLVGLREHIADAEALRRQLSTRVYLWINACKDVPDYYAEAEILRWEAIDPLFRINLRHHPSRGRLCRAGGSVISVDGKGTIRRCHFIGQSLGNLYESGPPRRRTATACTNETCGCHIGYVHLEELGLWDVFRGGALERIPRRPVWRTGAARQEALQLAAALLDPSPKL
ncbi:MAG: radical SAM protein [Pirellulales bacterium]|nr:radical SAM protein [Pirellulales bacterium]